MSKETAAQNAAIARLFGREDHPKTDEELRRRQDEHMEEVHRRMNQDQSREVDCLHNQCTECVGTGIRKDGTKCLHMISCPCSRCTPSMLSAAPRELVKGGYSWSGKSVSLRMVENFHEKYRRAM